MREEIVRFFECLIPITICNLRCEYCYVIQRNYRNMKKANLKYSAEQIGKALRKERLGGMCFFSICGAGETLAQPEIIDIVQNILEQGHVVNVTTNGTLTGVFKKIKNINSEYLKKLHFSFSLHYIELKRLNLLDTFFKNIKFVQSLGCSVMVQLNLCDQYLPYIEEIKNICKENIGAYPQIAATRDEKEGINKVKLYTNLDVKEYEDIGNSFNSELFKYTMKNFNVKRTEFCYAGDRSGILNLATGELKKCYSDPCSQNIFENINKKIKFEPIGNNCGTCFCTNSSHFMSLGVIDKDENISYCSLRDRPEANWFNETTRKLLSQKLIGNKIEYSEKRKKYINSKEKRKNNISKIKNRTKFVIKKIMGVKGRCQEPRN